MVHPIAAASAKLTRSHTFGRVRRNQGRMVTTLILLQFADISLRQILMQPNQQD
jgi:hypothetical protein